MKLLITVIIFLFLTNAFASVDDLEHLIIENEMAQKELSRQIINSLPENTELKNSVFERTANQDLGVASPEIALTPVSK